MKNSNSPFSLRLGLSAPHLRRHRGTWRWHRPRPQPGPLSGTRQGASACLPSLKLLGAPRSTAFLAAACSYASARAIRVHSGGSPTAWPAWPAPWLWPGAPEPGALEGLQTGRETRGGCAKVLVSSLAFFCAFSKSFSVKSLTKRPRPLAPSSLACERGGSPRPVAEAVPGLPGSRRSFVRHLRSCASSPFPSTSEKKGT